VLFALGQGSRLHHGGDGSTVYTRAAESSGGTNRGWLIRVVEGAVPPAPGWDCGATPRTSTGRMTETIRESSARTASDGAV